jgi:hypothetical protein
MIMNRRPQRPLKKPCDQFYDSQNILRTFSKIDRIQNIIRIYLKVQLLGVRIAVNARMRFNVFMPKTKMSLNGRGFESPSGQKTIFPIKYTRNVKSMQNAVKSTVTLIER